MAVTPTTNLATALHDIMDLEREIEQDQRTRKISRRLARSYRISLNRIDAVIAYVNRNG